MQNNFTRGRSPRRAPFRTSRPTSRYGQRPFSHRGGFGGARRNASKGQSIHISKFINKATPVETDEIFVPKHKFADFLIEDRLKNNIAKKGYVLPTPIQDQSIPHILEGKDIVGLANTGTGKTAAFLIPIINKILKNDDTRVLIVAPTRELAIQIEEEFKGFTRGLNIFSVCLVGGAPIGPQIRTLRQMNHVVIGTPGRIKDLIEQKYLSLARVSVVVLDEADRMLDMGFINEIKWMMNLIPKEHQTLFFSATISKEIEGLIGQFLKNPVTVSVRTRDTSKSVDQDVVRVAPGQNKVDVLHDLLIKPEFNKVLVFGRTKHGVEKLAIELGKRGIRAESIHGNKTHGRRQKALSLFKSHHMQVLVATDVAARGLDIAGVSHVINFDIPATYEDYVHRIGRTGRAGKTGKALTFVS